MTAIKQGCPCGECRRAADWERLEAHHAARSSSTALGRLIVIIIATAFITVGAAGLVHGAPVLPMALALLVGVGLIGRMVWVAVKSAWPARHRTKGRQPTPAMRKAARRRAGRGYAFWLLVLAAAGWTLLIQTDTWEWRHTIAAAAAFTAAIRSSHHIDTLEDNREVTR